MKFDEGSDQNIYKSIKCTHTSFLKDGLSRNLCECILSFNVEIWGISENVPRFLKNANHIPEERHLGLVSLYTPSFIVELCILV